MFSSIHTWKDSTENVIRTLNQHKLEHKHMHRHISDLRYSVQSFIILWTLGDI